MTWTYTLSTLATSPLMQVRYLVGDTIVSDQQVQDEEISFALSQRNSIYGAASIVCLSLATRLSRQADVVDKDLRTALAVRAKAYAARGAHYDAQAKIRGGGIPYAGGLSIADKINNESNVDRVQPQYTINMDDNYIPVAPVGAETTGSPIIGGSGNNV